MLSVCTVVPNTLELLKRLAALPELKGMRLVGGTSLALQYGHRSSVDLDFFGQLSVSIDDVLVAMRKEGDCIVLNRTKNILQVVLCGVKVDVVDYSCYEWIDNPIEEEGIVLASPEDIAALKVNAVEGRGTKKDFQSYLVVPSDEGIIPLLLRATRRSGQWPNVRQACRCATPLYTNNRRHSRRMPAVVLL